jgi:hypothetical protein
MPKRSVPEITTGITRRTRPLKKMQIGESFQKCITLPALLMLIFKYVGCNFNQVFRLSLVCSAWSKIMKNPFMLRAMKLSLGWELPFNVVPMHIVSNVGSVKLRVPSDYILSKPTEMCLFANHVFLKCQHLSIFFSLCVDYMRSVSLFQSSGKFYFEDIASDLRASLLSLSTRIFQVADLKCIASFPRLEKLNLRTTCISANPHLPKLSLDPETSFPSLHTIELENVCRAACCLMNFNHSTTIKNMILKLPNKYSFQDLFEELVFPNLESIQVSICCNTSIGCNTDADRPVIVWQWLAADGDCLPNEMAFLHNQFPKLVRVNKYFD